MTCAAVCQLIAVRQCLVALICGAGLAVVGAAQGHVQKTYFQDALPGSDLRGVVMLRRLGMWHSRIGMRPSTIHLHGTTCSVLRHQIGYAGRPGQVQAPASWRLPLMP